MSERSDAVRQAFDAANTNGHYAVSTLFDGLKPLLDEHERMEDILAVARGFLATTGPFVASDGYVSVKVGDPTPLRKALATFDGYETRVPDQERVYEADYMPEWIERYDLQDPDERED